MKIKNTHYRGVRLSVLVLSVALLALLPFATSPIVRAQEARAPFKLTAENVEDGAWLDKSGWAYRMGDDPAWAAKDYDDSAWATTGFDELVSGRGASPSGERWNGAAWFRLRLEVDDRLVNRPLALRMQHWGASEVYIDGNLVRRFGVIEVDRDVEENPRWLPVPFVFTEGGGHTIAVRYSYKAARDTSSGVGRWLMHGHFRPGFRASVRFADAAVERYGVNALAARSDWLYVGVLAALALLHFLLYLFYRRERANLFYSLFALSLAATLLLNDLFNSDTLVGARSGVGAGVSFVLFAAAFAVAFSSLAAFLYVAFGERITKRFWLLPALWLGAVVLVALYLRENVTLYAVCLALALTLIEAIRVMVRALIRRRPGAWIVMAGVSLFAFSMCASIGQELFGYRLVSSVGKATDILILLAVPVSVSVFLARNFARTNRDLEAQLAQVKELSARELGHERAAAELRLKHEQERAENERRANELEEARQLQLSMLPKFMPQLPHLDIAAYMKPASEVGGDYYDFHVGEDGTLTVAVGDATGHGLKAGTVVTAAKSLFNAFAHESDILAFFRQSSRSLKGMNLRSLYMAMTMVKIKDGHLTISMAGMPPALVYRAATRCVEEVALKAMPLGSVRDFPYQQRELRIYAGDTVVLMSDGFAERFNERSEMLDYAQAKTVLEEVAHESPQDIINHFVRVGDEWAGARPQDDDVTFVVLKVKNGDGHLA